jgi:hypothetical protein
MHLADSGFDVYRLATLILHIYYTKKIIFFFIKRKNYYFRSLRPLFLSLLPWSQSSIQNLRAAREQLSHDLTNLINELGPKMYPNFGNSRIVKEFRDRSPSPSRPSSIGRLFPLTDWLDDKVFNWSRADDSDYDDVFFFLDQQNKSVVGRSRDSSGRNSSLTRSRANSTGSSDGFNSSNLAFTEVNKRPAPKVPKVQVKDFDEDPGYHGDKEIESKKSV